MKAKNVRGFMIKKERLGISDSETLRQMVLAVNESIDMQGKRDINLNRERLARSIYLKIREAFGNEKQRSQSFEETELEVRKFCYALSDAIIAAEADILESPTKGY